MKISFVVKRSVCITEFKLARLLPWKFAHFPPLYCREYDRNGESLDATAVERREIAPVALGPRYTDDEHPE